MSIEMRGEAKIHIAAPAEKVYALISDVTRMGEWSPECVAGTWSEGSHGPVVGAQFHGTNRRGTNEWTTPNTVLVADKPHNFAWVVGTPDFQVCRWSYVLVPDEQGTSVTESFELGDQSVGFASMVEELPPDERDDLVDARRRQLTEDMHHTLRRLKTFVENGA